MTKYALIGVLYYVIYNPNYARRDKHDSFEVYRLENGIYVRQFGNPFWMPEISLAIGYQQGTHDRWTREWLYWYDQNGIRFPTPQDVIEQERQRVQQEQQRAQQEQQRAEQEQQRAQQEQQRADNAQQQLAELIAKLQERGINLDDL